MTRDGSYIIGCGQCIALGHAFIALAGTKWGVTEALRIHVADKHGDTSH